MYFNDNIIHPPLKGWNNSFCRSNPFSLIWVLFLVRDIDAISSHQFFSPLKVFNPHPTLNKEENFNIKNLNKTPKDALKDD